jgi:hypothetical protein
MAMFVRILSPVLAAMSFGPSFAHVLEALPRLSVWTPELWREATVFNGEFILFLWVGAPIDVAAILAAALLAFILRGERPGFRPAALGAALLAAALAAWFALVAPANAILATWTPGPIPADFDAVRLRWETGHMVVAALKLAGLISICAALDSARGRPYSRS